MRRPRTRQARRTRKGGLRAGPRAHPTAAVGEAGDRHRIASSVARSAAESGGEAMVDGAKGGAR